MKPIPVNFARRIAEDYGYDQVVIIGRKTGEGDGTGEHVTTYGTTVQHCRVASMMGNFFKYKLMGWEPPKEEVAKRATLTLEEECRAFCAWKGGSPCLLTECPRRKQEVSPA